MRGGEVGAPVEGIVGRRLEAGRRAPDPSAAHPAAPPWRGWAWRGPSSNAWPDRARASARPAGRELLPSSKYGAGAMMGKGRNRVAHIDCHARDGDRGTG